MKKFSILSALVVAVSVLSVPTGVNAAEDEYKAALYIKSESADGVTVISDDTIQISADAVRSGDFVLDMSVFVDDDLERIYAISAFWNCNSEYITLQNLKNPEEENIPFCYGVLTADGTYTTNSSYKLYTATAPQLSENAMSLSCQYVTAFPTPLALLGDDSDSYSFADFQAAFASDIPEGVYTIDFYSKENPEPVSEGKCTASYAIENSVMHSTVALELKSFTIVVGEYPEIGDINDDGKLTPTDAATTLGIYADSATGAVVNYSSFEILAADVNEDGKVTSSDAALILSYYAYVSTTNSDISFKEYLSQQI